MSALAVLVPLARVAAQNQVPPPAGSGQQNPTPTPSAAGAPQGPPAQDPQGVEVLVDSRAAQLLGKTVRAIRVLQLDRQGVRPMPEETADPIVRGLATRPGQPLQIRRVTEDVAQLWHERRLAVRAYAQQDGDVVDLYLIVELEVEIFESVEFTGLRRLQRREVEVLLGLVPDRQVTNTEAQAMRNVLVANYRRDGYAFCSIALEPHALAAAETSSGQTRRSVTFRIDEGPRVTVGELTFRGNRSFPASPSLGFLGSGDYLQREAHIQSDPAWALGSGGAYSREVLEEDLDRLSLFYRSRGFLDAIVSVSDVRFRNDHTVVDIDFQVVEGPRYVVRAVRVVHVDRQGHELAPGTALYPPAEIERELKTKVGDFYDHPRIRRDQRAIEDFYGMRGHPASSFPGMERAPSAFQVGWPRERYDESGGVELVFEVQEGTPKTLREVLIRGNTGTRDEVIRRKVFALPGERLDMRKVDRSILQLERTRFFEDPLTQQGPRFELMPVKDRDDQLDLAIDVKEGDTGELRWGVGISTGSGAQASILFRKRNFDMFRLPSSGNPVTVIEEIFSNKAFHGGGQNLDMLLAPGTQVSQFNFSITEPDVFGDHFDPTELRVRGQRRIRRFRDYTIDTLGADVGLSHAFADEFRAGFELRQETVEVRDIAPDASRLVFDAEGTTELRGIGFDASYSDLDNALRPTTGVSVQAHYDLLGGPFGGGESLWKANATANVYFPIAENALGHRTVLHIEQGFGLAQAFGGSREVFAPERYYLGLQNLRGFDLRGVGPAQFGRHLGGEALANGTIELSYPLVPARLERDVRERELIRGVFFVDWGLLGLSLGDATFREPRMSYGLGIRIAVPVLEVPIALDLAWPILWEETDDRRQFFFNFQW